MKPPVPGCPGRRCCRGEAESNDNVGWAVDVDGNTAIVGAPNDDNANGDRAGAAYVYTQLGSGVWIQQAKLTASDGGENAGFGGSVALDGDTALVGAKGADNAEDLSQGAAYVFTRTAIGQWEQRARLQPEGGDFADEFGVSVALDGDTALVGSRFADSAAGPETGAAWVFERDGSAWSQQAKLVADDAERKDEIGIAVDLDGDRALLGSQAFEGAAYVFERDGASWTEQARIVHPEDRHGVFFGRWVALDAETVLIGAPGDVTDSGAETGAAYVFTRSTDGWTLETELTPVDGEDRDKFGFAVALDGNTALVGSPLAEDLLGAADAGLATETGAGYVYERLPTRGWLLQSKLVPPAGQQLDRAGFSVALDGGSAMLGAINAGNLELDTPHDPVDPDAVTPPESGAVYPFQTVPQPGITLPGP